MPTQPSDTWIRTLAGRGVGEIAEAVDPGAGDPVLAEAWAGFQTTSGRPDDLRAATANCDGAATEVQAGLARPGDRRRDASTSSADQDRAHTTRLRRMK